MRNRGYYLNSLRSWRHELQEKQQTSKARLSRMQEMNHPDAGDQELYIALRAHIIGLIDIAEAEALKTHKAA